MISFEKNYAGIFSKHVIVEKSKMAAKMAATLQICDIYASICPTNRNEVSGCMFFGTSKLIKSSYFVYMQNLPDKIQNGVQNGCQKPYILG